MQKNIGFPDTDITLTYNLCVCRLKTGLTDSSILFTTPHKCLLTMHYIAWLKGVPAEVTHQVFFVKKLTTHA